MAGDTRLTSGTGDGGDWDAGNFTVARGLWNGGHTDRFLGFIDEVRISDEALTVEQFLFSLIPDSDGDGLADLWEDLYFGNNDGTPSAGELALQDGTGDPDDDGYDNEAEETAGSNPTVKGSIPGDTDGDGLGDVWEKAYFGDLDEVGTGDPDTDGYTNEAEETAGSNPTDINSIPGDVDADDLADAWEQLYFGNLNETGAGDTDGDLATNEEEETAGSNPASFDSWPDSDADGLNDAWEVANFTDLSKDGTADTDTDGFTDLEEFGANTDPADSAFSPAFAKGRHQWSFTNTLADSIGGSTAQIVPGGSANPAVLGATYVQMAGGAKDTSDYVLLGTNLLKGTSTPITIELWATQNTTQNWSRIFDFHASTSEKLYMSWTTGTDLNTDRVEWGDANGENVLVDSTNAPYSLLTKFHIVMVVEPGAGADGTTRVTWYSAPAAAGTDLGPAQGTFDTTNNLVNLDDVNDTLGRSPYGDNAPSATYDEVRIWNGALAPWLREALHDQGPDDMTQYDADADGLPDAWEASYPAFPAATSGATDDPDGDLTDNRHELLFGTDPTDPASNAEDTDADGLLDAWEIANFGAIASQDGYGDPDTDRATNEEEETAATDPNDDTSFPDTDGDGLCDGWEVYYFTDLSETGTADTDGDTFDHLAEQAAKTNPLDVLSNASATGDTDGDGLDDRWEVAKFGDITSQDGTGDPDSDGAPNLAEYQAMSEPNITASTPTDVNGDGTSDQVSFLGFDAAGTGINDKDGVATGLTQRLANTGTDATFTPNDPNLDLDTAAGTLAITSTSADLNGQANLAVSEMPGIPLSALGFTGAQDFKVRAKYVNLPATLPWDQLGVFAGGSSTAVVRGGRITERAAYGTNTNGTNDGDTRWPGDFEHLAAGRSATVELSRTAGVWALAINGVDITPGVQPAFLDALSDLTVGVFVADVNATNTQSTATLDSFTVVVMGSASPDADNDGLDDGWEVARFGDASSQDGAGDPDNDGVPNLAEFAFNGDPNNPADRGTISHALADTDSNSQDELTLTIAVRAGATFAAGANGTQTATVGTLTYTVEGSLDLAAFASSVSWVGSAASGDPDWELHTFRLDASQGLPGKGFLRVKVSTP